ncbi:MAG: nuclear transport factor 2 family protein [Saprospiraceae bacterium]|nr:nuclear transport factor 2 family protein [Saprospiraceae bacterium]
MKCKLTLGNKYTLCSFICVYMILLGWLLPSEIPAQSVMLNDQDLYLTRPWSQGHEVDLLDAEMDKLNNVILNPIEYSAAKQLMERHLKSVMDKDTVSLRQTLNMGGRYLLILPDGSSMETADEFYAMHQAWFQDKGWTMEMNVLDFRETPDMAQCVVDAMFHESDRNVKPYYHKMWITYVLEHIGGQWYVTSDHASTKTKSE